MKPTFLTLIQMFQMEGMVALGKMLNPATNTLTPNQDHARYVIDILEVLRDKTAGNRSSDEDRFLDQTLSTLKLNFIQTETAPPADSRIEGAS